MGPTELLREVCLHRRVLIYRHTAGQIGSRAGAAPAYELLAGRRRSGKYYRGALSELGRANAPATEGSIVSGRRAGYCSRIAAADR